MQIVQTTTGAQGTADGRPVDDASFVVPEVADPASLASADLTAGWVVVDATLVFRSGSGWLCEIDDTVSVADLAVCGNPDGVASEVEYPVVSSSGRPDLFTWMGGPVIYPFRPRRHLRDPNRPHRRSSRRTSCIGHRDRHRVGTSRMRLRRRNRDRHGGHHDLADRRDFQSRDRW